MPKTRFSYRHQYDDARDAEEREATNVGDLGPSMTQQHFTEEADLNIMMRRMGLTDNALPPQAMNPEFFGDFGEPIELRDVFDRVRAAHERFAELPADIRKRFDHDPAKLLAFVHDPANAEESVKMGFLEKVKQAGGEPPAPPTPATT